MKPSKNPQRPEDLYPELYGTTSTPRSVTRGYVRPTPDPGHHGGQYNGGTLYPLGPGDEAEGLDYNYLGPDYVGPDAPYLTGIDTWSVA